MPRSAEALVRGAGRRAAGGAGEPARGARARRSTRRRRRDPDTADHEKAGGARAGGGLSESNVDQAEDLFLRFQGDRRGSIEQLDKVLWHFVEGLEQTSRTLLLLAPQHASDQRLGAHSLNVSLLALAQARALGIGGQTLHDIGLGALLHDIGKLSLPRAPCWSEANG